ncbi:MAG: sigma-70 family RNA polymerase sigma factor [Gemmatimonadota bacterium]
MAKTKKIGQGTMFGKRRERQKKQAEFEAELGPHLDALYGAAFRLTRNGRDAEDLVQETVLRAFRHFEQYQKGTKFRAWLFKIQTNTFINLYRQRSRDAKLLSSMDVDGMPDRIPSTELMKAWSDPERAIAFQGVGKEVKGALESLPVDYRWVVMLADLYDFTYKEIAEILGCPIGTVMSRLFRGRQLLQKSLFRYALAEGILVAEGDGEGNAASLEEFRRRKKELRRSQ